MKSCFKSILIVILCNFICGCAIYHHLEVINESGRQLQDVKVTYIDREWSFVFGNMGTVGGSAGYNFNNAGIPSKAKVEWIDEQTRSTHAIIVPVRSSIPYWINLKDDSICFLINSPTNVAIAFWEDQGDYRKLFIQGESEESLHQRELNNRLIQSLRDRDLNLASQCIQDGASVHCRRLGTNTTPLGEALGDFRCVALLMKHKTPIRGELPLAVRYGDTRVLELLIAAGADLNATSPWQQSPLTTAVEMGDIKLVRFLLDNGADVNKPIYHGITPIYTAVLHHRHQVARLLIARGANVNVTLTDSQRTPLDMARQSQDKEMQEILISADGKYKNDHNN